MPKQRNTFRLLLLTLFGFLACSSSLYAQVGGGYTAGGLQGEYFANGELSGTPLFTRREVRLDFDWGTLLPVGGSNDPRYRTFPHDNFSARYTGQIVAAFSESYTFKTMADDGVRFFIRPEGSGVWTLLIDAWDAPATSSGTADLMVGQRYDLKVEYRQLTGTALLRLFWSSRSTPEEVIDPAVEQGYNVGNWGNAFADLVKCSRNSWLESGNGPVPLDADGWPLNDASYLYQESANTGLDLDPLMTGTITFSFNGTGDIDLFNGNQERSTLKVSYDAATNSTSGSFMTKPSHWNASYFIVRNTDRDGQTPPRHNGITNLKLIRPKVPGGTEPYPPGTVFNDHFRTAYSKFTSLRVNLNNANVERFWSDRTLPGYFNQANGKGTLNAYPPNAGQNNTPMASDNGASWEHKIMMANETGADLYLNLPMMVTGWTPQDTGSYVHKLARLLRYGSDGVEPYSGPTADPLYPPLNPNLRVYLELSNEVWNMMNFGFRQSFDLLTLTTLDADAALGDPVALADPLARPADFPIINYDNLSTQKDSGNWYLPINTWNKRKQILRVIQISSIFRSVWGDGNMMSRIRPIYEWQYDNANNTANFALTFANDWFNNGNGLANVAEPHPVNYFIWGGGGASYYGAVNGYGTTDLLPNPGFESPVVTAGYSQNPAGAGWVFEGTAGIARDGGSGDDIPPPFEGSQMGYIDGSGSMSIQVKIPATQTSNHYAFVFKALQRVESGAPLDTNGNPAPDSQKLRVFIDGVESNWKSFNQWGGYTPLPYDPYKPWNSFVVFWTSSTPYYSTIGFTAMPGSTVTLRIEGSAAPGQIAFLEDVRLSSIDQMFADGFPGGGEAAGQPAGSGYQNGLNVQSAWAHAFGLRYVTYEGGWSLGGDTGGTPLQNLAKYNDPGTVEVNSRAITMFQKAGGSLNTFGTYTLWPGWGEVYAEEGMLDVTRYPLMISQADRMNNLPSDPTNGVFLPNFLTVTNSSLKSSVNVSGALTGRGWLSWNIISAVTTTYTITVVTTTGGTAQLSLDGVPLDGPIVTGQPFSRTVTLTRGMHSIRLNGMGGDFTLQQVTVAIVGAPDLPTISSVTDTSGSLIVTWTPIAGATEYIIRWGTESNRYDFSTTVGDVTSYVITGLAHDTTYYVAVFAVNGAGSSLPSPEVGRTALVDGLAGHLVSWNFDGDTGTLSSHPPTAKSSRLMVTDLVYGPGLQKSGYGITYSADSFAYQRANGLMDSDSLTLDSAFASGQYSEFTLTPTPGATVSLSSVMFVPYWQNYAKLAGVAWSVDNGPYTIATMSGTPRAYVGNPLIADLSEIPQLHSIRGTVHLRLLHTGISRYEFAGLGRHPGDDIVVMGSVLSGTVDGSCGAADGQDFTVPPVTAPDLCAGGSASVVTGSGPWSWSCIGQYGGATAACATHTNSYGVANATLKEGVSDGGSLTGPGWLSWDLNSAAAEIYTITVTTGGGGIAQLSLDGTPLDIPFTTGQPFTTMVTLTRGMHTIRLSGMGGNFTVQQVTVAILSIPDRPIITSLADVSGSLVVTWTPAARAAGYTVRWGTQPNLPLFSAAVGDASRYVITGLDHDTTYYVTVSADNAAGSSFPSAEVAQTALKDGLSGHLARWNFDYDPGTVSSHPPTAKSSRLEVTDLVYGPGFRKSDYELGYTVDSFAYQRALWLTDADALTLESTLASGLYSEFTLKPTPGTTLSLSSVMFAPYWAADPLMCGVAWSVDGSPYVIATMSGAPSAYSGSPLTADLAQVPQLHSVTGTLRLRLLHVGIQSSYAGIGRHPGDDIVVMGTLVPGMFTISTAAGANGSITPTATVNYGSSSGVTVSPATGYHIDTVLVDGVSRLITEPKSYSTTFSTVTANHTVDATFAIDTFIVTFNSNGGSAVSGQTVAFNTTAALPAAPTRTGYTFAGWFSDTALTAPFVFTKQVTADTTLYAKWTSATTRTNVALQANGGVATASNTASANYPASSVNNGDRNGSGWDTGGGWYNGKQNNFPEWVQLQFNGQKNINEVDVFSIQDAYASPIISTTTALFTKYGVTSFNVQYCPDPTAAACGPTGTGWATVTNGSVTGNNLVWRTFTFPAVTTDRIRVQITATVDGYSRLAEVEAYETAGGVLLPTTPTITWTNPAAITYGTTLSTTQLNATASVPGTFSYTPTGGTVLNAGIQTLSVTFIPTDTVTYSTVTATVGLVVNKVTSVITWASPAAVAVGTTLSATQLNAIASVAGTFAYTPAAGTVLSTAGTQALSVTFTPKDPANYTGATASLSLTVTGTVTRTNVALQANGGVATTSNTASASYPASSINNGDRKGLVWGAGGGWYNGKKGTFPEWVQVQFNGQKTIDEIDVFSIQDAFTSPIIPTSTTLFTKYGVTAFNVQYCTDPTAAACGPKGTGWATITNGSVTGNNLVWRTFTFPAVTTDRIRVQVMATVDGYSRLAEVEAYGTAGGGVLPTTPVITWATPATVTVGTSLSTTQLNATASVAGTFTYAPVAGTVLSTAGTQILSVTFTPSDTANYTVATASLSLTVMGTVTSTNVALQANGGVVTASNTASANYPASSVNNGDRKGSVWGAGGGWYNGKKGTFPEWVQVQFNGQKTINGIDVFSIQDAFTSPLIPTTTTLFTKYGVTAFNVQYCTDPTATVCGPTGTGWATVTNGSITGNNLVWRTVTFPTVITDRIRVQITATVDGYSRLAEIEVSGY